MDTNPTSESCISEAAYDGSPAPQRSHAMLPAELLREILTYDPEAGTLEFTLNPGKSAVQYRKGGKRVVFIAGSQYLAARVVCVMQIEDDLTSSTVEHIDGDRGNLKWENLRIVAQKRGYRKPHVPGSNVGFGEWAAKNVRVRNTPPVRLRHLLRADSIS